MLADVVILCYLLQNQAIRVHMAIQIFRCNYKNQKLLFHEKLWKNRLNPIFHGDEEASALLGTSLALANLRGDCEQDLLFFRLPGQSVPTEVRYTHSVGTLARNTL